MRTAGDTMEEGLSKILSQLSQLAILPDADLEFLGKLQQLLTQYMRAKQSQTASAAAGVSQGMAAGQPAGGMPGMGAPSPQQIAPGGGAGMSGLMGAPNPDELRRVLAGSQMSG